MSNYVSLEEAAKILGITTDELIEMRSRNEIFGYRDGTSWKFKKEEIDRVQVELGGDALDEEAGGSSILVSERQVGPAGSKVGSTIGKGAGSDSDLPLDSDLKLAQDRSPSDSDVALIADPRSDSGVKLVTRSKSPLGEGSSLSLDHTQEEGGSGGSNIEVDLGSDLRLAPSPEASGIDLLKGAVGSNVLDSQINNKTGSGTGSKSGTGSGNIDLADLELAKDDEDDLVLGSDSGLALGAEINLMSPSDSGLSLDDEPLDLAGTGISGLDLGGEVGSRVGSGTGKSGVGSGIGSALGSGALVDFQPADEFRLTPAGGIETDDDSSSQVIELEDSSITDLGELPAGPGDGPVWEPPGGETYAGPVGAMSVEVPYTGLQVGMLTVILLLMGLGGILTTDILRNLWEWNGTTDYSTGLTSMLVKAFGGS